MTVTEARIPQRFVISGVPRVGFYRGGELCPEDAPFPACLTALLHHLNEGLGVREFESNQRKWMLDELYTAIMGISGAAFYFGWKPGWHTDNADFHHMSEDSSAPYSRALMATGHEFEFVPCATDIDEMYLKGRLRESIAQRGTPVLVFGVAGPVECALVTGYDQDGQTLIGWSFYQEDPSIKPLLQFEPNGYFRHSSPYHDITGAIILGERVAPFFPDSAFRAALEWGERVGRTHFVATHSLGHDAYEMWASQVESDPIFTQDVSAFRHAYCIHDSTVGQIAESRWYATEFLRMCANRFEMMRTELEKAAAEIAKVHEKMWEIWGVYQGRDFSDEAAMRFAPADVRKKVATLIREASALETAALDTVQVGLNRTAN